MDIHGLLCTDEILNSKSSLEAEMIAVSDGLNHVLWLRNFLEDQGYKMPPAKVFQDNMSAIRLFQTGSVRRHCELGISRFVSTL